MSFNFMAAITVCSDFGAQKIKSATVSTVPPSVCHEVLASEMDRSLVGCIVRWAAESDIT